MGNAQFVDISALNSDQIDWPAYKVWSASGDGISRVAMRASYGIGYPDTSFAKNRAGALSVGIDQIIFYHYSYPQYDDPAAAANWHYQVVGAIRASDTIMLDYEENVASATADWAYKWLVATEQLYGRAPGVYSYPSYIVTRLQDARLARFPLWYANWQYTPDERPPAPAPWSSYQWLQYSDKSTNIPGITGEVDADVYISGGNSTMNIPSGWYYDEASQTLYGPPKDQKEPKSGVPVRHGFKDHILNDPAWDPANVPLEEEYGANPVQLHRPDLGGGTRQCFRGENGAKDILWWTSKTGVIEEQFVGLELDAAYKRIAALENQVADQQSQIAKLQSQIQQPTIVEKIPDAIMADIKTIQSAFAQLTKDAGL